MIDFTSFLWIWLLIVNGFSSRLFFLIAEENLLAWGWLSITLVAGCFGVISSVAMEWVHWPMLYLYPSCFFVSAGLKLDSGG